MGKLVGCEYIGGGGGWRQEGTILIPIAIAGLISTLIRGKKRLVLSPYKKKVRGNVVLVQRAEDMVGD